MAKLHEILAAEKTPNGAWNQLYEDTLKKFKNPQHYFDGYTKTLSMLEETDANKAIEDSAREEKPVTTTVYETLEYALGIYERAEDLQYQKNATNRVAVGTVMWRGEPLLENLPVDELLGLESRLQKIRKLFEEIPTIDSSKHWERSEHNQHVWELAHPEVTTKTEKQMTPVVMHPATDKHPAQVQAVTKDIVVGRYTLLRRHGGTTAYAKAEAIKRIDELLMEVKQARMRANETEAVNGGIADKIVGLLLEPLR